MLGNRRCSACGTMKPPPAFSPKQAKCKECRREVARQRRRKNAQRRKKVRATSPPEWPGSRNDWNQARENARRWYAEIPRLEARIAESERDFRSRPEFERSIYEWEHERVQKDRTDRLSKLLQWIADLELKGMTPERAEVMENSSRRVHARKLDALVGEILAETAAEREAWRQDNPALAKLQDDEAALLLLASFLPEQWDNDDEAHDAAHRAGLRAADRARGNPDKAYRKAFAAAYRPDDATEAPLFEWPAEWLADPQGTLKRLLRERQRDHARRRYLAKMGGNRR